MRIAVIADTHDHCPPTLPNRLRGADEIWHLGDVCSPNTLAAFGQLKRPLRVVQGNNDAHPWPVSLGIEKAGQHFFLIHIPPRWLPTGVRTVLHGHTHVPRDETIDGVRWLNPGCISLPRGVPASFAWLTVAPGKVPRWEIVRL